MIKGLNVSKSRLFNPLFIYGLLLLVYTILSTLYVASLYKVGYFIVIRRVSVYRVVDVSSGYILLLTALAVTLMILALLSWRTVDWRARLLLLIAPLTTVMLVTENIYIQLIYLVLILVVSTILVVDVASIRRGVLAGLILLASLSTVELLIASFAGLDALHIHSVVNSLLGVFQPLSPFILLLLLGFSLGVVPLLVVRGKERSSAEEHSKGDYIYPLLGMIISLILYMIPYTVVVNPSRAIATTDILVYVDLLNEMNRIGDPFKAAITLRQGDRLLYMLLLYNLQKLLGFDSWCVSTISGWLWTPLLVFSTWYMTRKLYGGEVSKHVALITPLSTQMLGFIYGGFQANQLNLALLFLSIGLLADSRVSRIVVGSALLLTSSMVHLWSWVHIAPAILIWVTMDLLVKKGRRCLLRVGLLMPVILVAILIVGSTGALDYVLSKGVLRLLDRTLSTPLEAKLNGLYMALTIYVWGSLNNPILLLTGIGGYALKLKESGHTPLDYLFTATLLGLYALAPDITMVARLLLNTPIHILTGLYLPRVSRQASKALYLLLLYNALYMALNAPP